MRTDPSKKAPIPPGWMLAGTEGMQVDKGGVGAGTPVTILEKFQDISSWCRYKPEHCL